MLDSLQPTVDMTASWRGRNVVVLSPTPTYPLDAGNRRRVFHLTTSLRDLGARIIFVHYPSESEWRTGVPTDSVSAMSAQWDEYYTVPVTVPLHPNAIAGDHLADEWWDPAIADMLAWVFRTHVVDVLLVNYTWLTRAFESCPIGMLRVLDTHDRFSGRRELLASAGIGPEFFHTTEAEERKALARAHVIWSIKPQEAEFFASLGMKHVVNMPYFEPVDGPPVSRAKREVLRFGMVGAANSVNLVNTKAFLAAIRAYVARTLLPCEIVIAGGICALLDPPDVPWIHVLGRLPDLTSFYEYVDVVVAPISVSTGLKIKVGEALCQGKAVVALAHAFEGYPARHPFHTLSSLDEMMGALRCIVNEPSLVDRLEHLSTVIVRDLQAELAYGLAYTVAELERVPPCVCVVIRLEDLFEGSMVLDHLLETADYVGNLTDLSVFVDGGVDDDWDAAPLYHLACFGCLILAPHPDQARIDRRLREMGLSRARWLSLTALTRTPQIAFWFASARHKWDLPAIPIPTRAYINLDLAVLGSAESDLPRMQSLLIASFHEVVTMSRRGLLAYGGKHGTWTHRVPGFWRGERSQALARLRAGPRESIVILADSVDDPLLGLTWSVVSRLSARLIQVVVARQPARGFEIEGVMPGAVLLPLVRCFAEQGVCPMLVIDISSDHQMECAREIIDRSDLPCLTLFSDQIGLPEYSSVDRGVAPAIASGLFASTALLAEMLSSATMASTLVAERARAGNYRNDAGWALIWTEMKELAQSMTESVTGHYQESGTAA